MENKTPYLKSRIKSFGYAFKGIATLLKSQPNAQIHLLATILVTGLGFIFDISAGEWTTIILCISGVWAMEAMNTALEFLTNLVSPNHHPLAGKAKDVAAAGVLLMAIGALICAVIIFFPKFQF